MEFLDNGAVSLDMCSSFVASSATRVIKIHSLIFKSAPTGRIFMKFDIWGVLENLLRKLKSH